MDEEERIEFKAFVMSALWTIMLILLFVPTMAITILCIPIFFIYWFISKKTFDKCAEKIFPHIWNKKIWGYHYIEEWGESKKSDLFDKEMNI